MVPHFNNETAVTTWSYQNDTSGDYEVWTYNETQLVLVGSKRVVDALPVLETKVDSGQPCIDDREWYYSTDNAYPTEIIRYGVDYCSMDEMLGLAEDDRWTRSSYNFWLTEYEV